MTIEQPKYCFASFIADFERLVDSEHREFDRYNHKDKCWDLKDYSGEYRLMHYVHKKISSIYWDEDYKLQIYKPRQLIDHPAVEHFFRTPDKAIYSDKEYKWLFYTIVTKQFIVHRETGNKMKPHITACLDAAGIKAKVIQLGGGATRIVAEEHLCRCCNGSGLEPKKKTVEYPHSTPSVNQSRGWEATK